MRRIPEKFTKCAKILFFVIISICVFFQLRWLLDHVPKVKSAYDEARLCFGTVDAWLLWSLTSGHPKKGR